MNASDASYSFLYVTSIAFKSSAAATYLRTVGEALINVVYNLIISTWYVGEDGFNFWYALSISVAALISSTFPSTLACGVSAPPDALNELTTAFFGPTSSLS